MKRALDAGAVCVVVLGMAGAVCLGAAPAAQAGTSTQANPTVVFDTPGTKQVTLTVCNNPNSCATLTKSVVVLDPTPVVLSAFPAVQSAEVGQLVQLAGVGKGRPPLTYTWRVTPPAGAAFDVPGATAWWNTTGLAPGLYQVALKISNSAGSATSITSTVTLVPEQAADFYTLSPCRAYDSRSGTPLTSGVARLIPVSGCGVPPGARAVAGNLTVVGPTGPGSLTMVPGNYPQLGTSTINFKTGAVRANSVVMPLATDGSATLSVLAQLSNIGTVHVIFDVSGYFKPKPVL